MVLAVLAVRGAGRASRCCATEQPGWWVRLWYPLDYREVVVGNARLYHLDPALVAAVIYEESRFDSTARSDAGAVGLMQLLPDTARGIALHTGGANFDPATDLLDPDLNVRYGCWYLRHLRQKYHRLPERRRAGAGRLQRRPGQRRPLDRRHRGRPAGGDPVSPRRATTWPTSSALQTLYRRAYHDELYG